MSARWAKRALLAAGALLLLLYLLQSFVAGIYRVDSASMEPTIHGQRAAAQSLSARGGERVLVRYQSDPAPERFDLVVVRRPGESRPIVKRAVGLPGESVRVIDGDLLVQGAQLPPEEPRPPWVPLFDSRWHAFEELFYFQARDSAHTSGWQRTPQGFELAGLGIQAESDAGMLLYHQELGDGWIGPDHERVHGVHPVNDAALEVELELTRWQEGGRLRLRLVEQADTFEALIVPLAGNTSARIELQRWSAGEHRRPLDLQERDFATYGRHQLRFSNRDNCLELWIDEQRVAQASYEANEIYRGEAAHGRKSVGARVGLGGEGLELCVHELRVLRDLCYVPLGRFGVDQPLVLGPEEYFLLGDNSADSTDSRSFGPVSRRDLLGSPLAVLWPRWRWLQAH